jgi:hypothetical protein
LQLPAHKLARVKENSFYSPFSIKCEMVNNVLKVLSESCMKIDENL